MTSVRAHFYLEMMIKTYLRVSFFYIEKKIDIKRV